MSQGKTKATLGLLTEQSRGGILHLVDLIDTGEDTRKACDNLIDKHAPSQPAHLDSIIEDEPPDVRRVMFVSLDASLIKSSASQVSRAAGPSGLDALSWRRLHVHLI